MVLVRIQVLHKILSLVAISSILTASGLGAADHYADRDRSLDHARWFYRNNMLPLEAVRAIHYIDIHRGWVELDDESRWELPFSALHTLRSWSHGERVYFRNSRPWVRSPYELVHISTEQTVPIRPVRGPSLFRPDTRFIAEGDRARMVLRLTDGSTWALSPDRTTEQSFYTWAANDVIMVGSNESFWGAEYPVLLYNCGADNWCAAQRIASE